MASRSLCLRIIQDLRANNKLLLPLHSFPSPHGGADPELGESWRTQQLSYDMPLHTPPIGTRETSIAQQRIATPPTVFLINTSQAIFIHAF